MEPIGSILRRHRLNSIERSAVILTLIAALYAEAKGRLKPTIDDFALVMARLGLRGLPALETTQGRALVRAIVNELDAIGGEVAHILEDAIAVEFDFARANFMEQLATLLPTATEAWLGRNLALATSDQIFALFGYLAPDGALVRYLTINYGRSIAEKISTALIAGMVGGRSPRETGDFIAQKLGLAMNDSLQIARTTTLWAYRAAQHSNYLANGHVLQGWIWDAAMDERTCLSCIYMHGSFHTLDEILNDHHQGRCAPVPVTKSCEELDLPCDDAEWPDPYDYQRGEDWFNELPADMQLRMMGPGIYNAWINNEFEFSQLSVTYLDPVWGEMRRQATLKELVGNRRQ